MKKLISLFIAITIVLSMVVFTGCSLDDEDTARISGGDSWTIMIYMCGTDLEGEDGSATEDINEMLSANLPENVNVVFETGGTQQWQNDFVDNSVLQRYAIEDGDVVLKDEQELASMGETDTLTSFLTWGKQNYEADKYMVIFWDHGGGSGSGVCVDELFDSDYLTISELSQGIKDSGINFEIIGFDTCLMATVENAFSVMDYGKYLVASEETESGYGWQYTTWLDYLSKDTSVSGADLGKVICDSYYSSCEESEEDSVATLSVTDLSKMTDVKEKFTEFASQLAEDSVNPELRSSIVKGVMKTEKYGGSTEEEGYSNMVDLADFASNTTNIDQEITDALISSINDAVVYEVSGSACSKAHGISVFYPFGATQENLDAFESACDVEEYVKFVKSIASVKSTSADSSNDSSSEDVEFSASVNDDGYYQLKITKGLDSVQSVKFEISCDSDGEYYIMGTDDDLDADWDNGVFTDNFRGVWLTIGDCYVAPELVNQNDDTNIYSVPILLNDDITNLRVMYDFNTDAFSIVDVYDGVSEGGMSSRTSNKLKDGDKLSFLFRILDDEDSSEYAQMDTVTYEEGISIGESDLFDGEYLYRFVIEDVYGNTYYSDFAVITYQDGEIEFN